MSFASEVKKELLDISDLDNCCKKALVLGFLKLSSEIIISNKEVKLLIKTTISNALTQILPLLKEWYNVEAEISYYDEESLSKRRFYRAIISNASSIIKAFYLMPTDELKLSYDLLKKSCCKSAFLRGCFIAKGSINDPRKNSYHFEISSFDSDIADFINLLFRNKDIHTQIINRRNNYVVYIKRSEDISNALAYIGADSGVFYFEDQRIVRDVSNMANRMTNCDIYNETKCASTSDAQLEAIKYIRDNIDFNQVPVRLQSIILLREQYPDSSYEELSIYSDNIFGKTLSKSGISHCLRDLLTYYKNIRKTI